MPHALINGVNLYYEVTGQGFPLVWSHEYAGGSESWDDQVRWFSRRYRVITYNARGYPPSDVPAEPQAYSQERSVEDLTGLLQYLNIDQAYLGGLSMGAHVVLSLALQHPEMTRGIIIAGAGTGSTNTKRFSKEIEAFTTQIDREGMETWAKGYAEGPTRVQLRRKDLKGWTAFAQGLMAHSALGSSLTLQGVQGERPSIYSMELALQMLQVPTLIIVGDEDDPCLEPALFMKRQIPKSGLVILPQTGHTLNLEEPDLFNRVVLNFLTAVEADRWARRDWGSGIGFLADTGTETSQS